MGSMSAFAHCWISHAIIIVALLMIVTPVRREWNVFATSTENAKSEQEIDDAGSAVQASRKDVIVLDEPVRSVSPEVELRKKSDRVVHQEGAVGAMGQSSKGRADDCCVPVVEAEFWEEFVNNPKWEWGSATDHEAYWNPLVSVTKTEQIFSKAAPCDRDSIMTLEHCEMVSICYFS